MNMYDKFSVISVLGCAFILGTSLAIPHAAKAEINRTDVYELKRPIILTKENQGEQIHVPAGQFVSVHLAENPTTGYRWTMIDNNAGMPVLAELFFIPVKQQMVLLENQVFIPSNLKRLRQVSLSCNLSNGENGKGILPFWTHFMYGYI